MNYEDAAKFKKGRDAARNALNKAVNELCNKYELNRFEVLHAIVDKSVTEVENQAQNYPGMFPLTISNGLAETYHAHTLALSEKAYAQANGLDEPAPAKKGGGLKGLFAKAPKPNVLYDPVPWSWTDVDEAKSANVTEAQLKAAAKSQKYAELYGLKYTPVAPTKNYNMNNGVLTEYIPLKPTLSVSDWEDHPNPAMPQVALGGTIAKSTVEQYGYELPKGYKFQDTLWGDYVVVKDYNPDTYPLKNTDGVVVEAPFNTWLSKSEAVALGIWSLNLPPGLQWAGPGPKKEGMGSWALIYKGADWPAKDAVDLDEHLAEYTEKYPAYGHACGSKGCLDVTLNPGESKTFSGAYLAGLGLKKNTLAVTFPDALEVEYVANMDLVKVSYPV